MSVNSQKPKIERLDIVLLLLVIAFLYLLVFRLPCDPFHHGGDQLIFADNAERMLNGEHIYRDFFQFTFPGTQLYYCVLILIFGAHYWILGFSAILIGALSFWCCLRISKHLIAGSVAYLPAILYAFFGLRWFGLDASHRPFAPFFVMAACLLLIKRTSLLNFALAGVFCALASFFTQERGVAGVAGIGLFILADNYFRGWRWKTVLRESFTVALAFAIALSLMCLYFVWDAGVETFVWSTLVYPTNYYKSFEYNDSGALLLSLKKSFAPGARIGEFLPFLFYAFTIPSAIIAFFSLFFFRRKRHDWEFWRGPALLAIVGAMLVVTTNAHILRYCIISVPSLVLFAWLLDYFVASVNLKRRLIAVVAFGLIVISVILAIRFQTKPDYYQLATSRGKVYVLDNERNQKYRWLAEHTKLGDLVMETPFPQIHFLLGLRPASRYSQFFPTEYTRPEFVAGAVADLEKTKPRYILWVNAYNKPEWLRARGDNLGPLSDYVISAYKPRGPIYPEMGEIGGESELQIWERIE